MRFGILTLHRFNGDESYPVVTADIRYFRQPDDQTTRLDFQVYTDPEPIQTTNNAVGSGGALDAVWQIVIPTFRLDLDTLVGRTFSIYNGYDTEALEYRTNFYYYDHATIDGSEITILRVDGDRLWVRITGLIPDIDYYDNSKPKTQIEIEASFSLLESTTEIRPVG